MEHRIRIAPSINLTDQVLPGVQAAEVTAAGADYIHVDVMDGRFVPGTTLGAEALPALCAQTYLPVEVHLMVKDPENSVPQFVKAGASMVTVHVEACSQLYQTVQLIRSSKATAGAAIGPDTPINTLQEVLQDLDLVLVLSVNPGRGGQTFIESTVEKIVQVRNLIDKRSLTTELAVDGGITADVAPRAIRAGARVLVAGTAIFHSGESATRALKRLQMSVRRRSFG